MSLVLACSNQRASSSRGASPSSVSQEFLSGVTPITVLKHNKHREHAYGNSLSLCLSVSQVYPLFALHPGNHICFQEADVETTADRDFICRSASKKSYVIIVERLKDWREEFFQVESNL